LCSRILQDICPGLVEKLIGEANVVRVEQVND